MTSFERAAGPLCDFPVAPFVPGGQALAFEWKTQNWASFLFDIGYETPPSTW